MSNQRCLRKAKTSRYGSLIHSLKHQNFDYVPGSRLRAGTL